MRQKWSKLYPLGLLKQFSRDGVGVDFPNDDIMKERGGLQRPYQAGLKGNNETERAWALCGMNMIIRWSPMEEAC